MVWNNINQGPCQIDIQIQGNLHASERERMQFEKSATKNLIGCKLFTGRVAACHFLASSFTLFGLSVKQK